MLFLSVGRTVIKRVRSAVQWSKAPRNPGCFLKSLMISRLPTRQPATSWALLTVTRMIPTLLTSNNLYITVSVNVRSVLRSGISGLGDGLVFPVNPSSVHVAARMSLWCGARRKSGHDDAFVLHQSHAVHVRDVISVSTSRARSRDLWMFRSWLRSRNEGPLASEAGGMPGIWHLNCLCGGIFICISP